TRGAKIDVAIAADQAHQEPDLLLAAVVAAPFATYPVLGHLVAQPVARTPDDAYVMRMQAHLLVQFAEHRLLGRFAARDAALRKLPGVFSYPLPPENRVPRIDQDDPDVGAIAVTVQHDRTPRSLTIASIIASASPRLPGGRQTRERRRATSDSRMKASQFHLSTQKEAPADAEVVSHRLMTRAGMIRKVAGGIYTYMPLGLRVIRKI